MRQTLLTVLILFLSACAGDSTTAPIPEVLNTNLHSERKTSWGHYGMSATNQTWRLISVDENGLQGTYGLTWENESGPPTRSSYELHFLDSDGTDVDQFYQPLGIVVEPGTPIGVSGAFTLSNVTTVSQANSITWMTVWGSFQPHDLTVISGALPSGNVGAAYSVDLEATGGDGPYAWTLLSGGLPDGVVLFSSSGVLGGTATSVGTSTFTLGVGSGWQTATKQFSITIN